MHRARTPPTRCIGYRRFIRRDGTFEAGRAETEHGGHVAGQNTGKIGICWAGGPERASGPRIGVNKMSPAQAASLIRLLRDLFERYPRAKVVGHRDLALTQCLCFDVIRRWEEVSRPPAWVPRDIIASVSAWFASFRRAFIFTAWR